MGDGPIRGVADHNRHQLAGLPLVNLLAHHSVAGEGSPAHFQQNVIAANAQRPSLRWNAKNSCPAESEIQRQRGLTRGMQQKIENTVNSSGEISS